MNRLTYCDELHNTMDVTIRPFKESDIPSMLIIWNEVVDSGISFPQTEGLLQDEALTFFKEQSFTGIAENADTGETLGLYILHPNNIGRCGHIANTSYAVKPSARGLHVGEALVKHSMKKGKELGFSILQFNAVVKTNLVALHLYKKLGFTQLGVIPKGFYMKDGSFEDIVLFYHTL